MHEAKEGDVEERKDEDKGEVECSKGGKGAGVDGGEVVGDRRRQVL